MRSLRLLFVLFFGSLGMAACADEVPYSSVLVTSESALPASATDRRGDGVLRDGTGRPVTHSLIGQTLPSFSGSRVNGQVFESAALEGRWTIVVAWGVWCHDSRNDMDDIASLSDRVAVTKGLDFVSVHVPQSAEHLDRMYRDYGSVRGFFESHGVSFPTVIDETGSLRQTLQIAWTPTYLVICPDLTVRGFRTDLTKSGDGALDTFLTRVEGLRAAQ